QARKTHKIKFNAGGVSFFNEAEHQFDPIGQIVLFRLWSFENTAKVEYVIIVEAASMSNLFKSNFPFNSFSYFNLVFAEDRSALKGQINGRSIIFKRHINSPGQTPSLDQALEEN